MEGNEKWNVRMGLSAIVIACSLAISLLRIKTIMFPALHISCLINVNFSGLCVSARVRMYGSRSIAIDFLWYWNSRSIKEFTFSSFNWRWTIYESNILLNVFLSFILSCFLFSNHKNTRRYIERMHASSFYCKINCKLKFNEIDLIVQHFLFFIN